MLTGGHEIFEPNDGVKFSSALQGKFNFFQTKTDALRGLDAISAVLPTDSISLFHIFLYKKFYFKITESENSQGFFSPDSTSLQALTPQQVACFHLGVKKLIAVIDK